MNAISHSGAIKVIRSISIIDRKILVEMCSERPFFYLGVSTLYFFWLYNVVQNMVSIFQILVF